MLVGFVVAPFLVHRLGQTRYGLWILIASFTNYFGLLDLGVRGAVGRNIAFHRAHGDQPAVNRTLSTALAFLCLAGALALLATLVLLPLFPRLFATPPEDLGEARLALLLVGLNLALWLPLNVFDATLWAYQRFDLLNGIDIPAALLRALLTFYLIGNGHGLVALAVVNLLSLAGAQGVKAVVSFWVDRELRLGKSHLTWEAARRVYGYGVWYFLQSVTRTATTQSSPILIGLLLSVRMVTLYSIASRLLGYAVALLVACTGVLTPVATALHAEDKWAEQQRLFLTGGKYCLALSLLILVPLVLLGAGVVTLWMGSELRPAAPLLVILVLGELLPASQLVTQSTILGMGRHRAMAYLGLVECLFAVGFAVLLSRSQGLLGVCVAFAVTGALCRGAGPMIYGCRLLQVPLRHYLSQAMLPPLLAAAPPTLFLALLVFWAEPTRWVQLAVYSVGYGVVAVLSGGLLVGYRKLWFWGERAARGLLGAR
jgi:O-antigen/teichoic acid export membrane protein